MRWLHCTHAPVHKQLDRRREAHFTRAHECCSLSVVNCVEISTPVDKAVHCGVMPPRAGQDKRRVAVLCGKIAWASEYNSCAYLYAGGLFLPLHDRDIAPNPREAI